MKIALEEVERDRDAYKYKLSERNRELDRLSEQVGSLSLTSCLLALLDDPLTPSKNDEGSLCR